MKMKRKWLLLLVSFVVATAFVGWKIKPVELIDDKLLIDLDMRIQDAGWGQEDSPDDGSMVTSPDDKNPDIDIPTDPDDRAEIMIVIRGEKVLVNEVHMKTTDALKKYLERFLAEEPGANTRVCLVDDYAEAHAYKKVYELLEQLQTQVTFEISEAMTEG